MEQIPENITNELLVAFLNGETTNEEMRLVQTWLESSEDNKKYVEDLKLIWTEAKKLNPPPVDVNIDKAWSKLSARIDNNIEEIEVKQNIKNNSSFTIRTLFKVAAVIIPAILISYLFFLRNNDVKQIVLASNTFPVEKQFSDGSKIRLNTNSKLVYPEKFAEKKREVELTGEAFFDIAADKEKPFIIHLKGANVRVVGTSFNVKTNKEFAEVFVKTGKVQLYGIDNRSNDTSLVNLTPGEKGIYDFKTNKAYKQELPCENDLFWISKTLIFKKTELLKVVETLKDKYNVDIRFKNNKLKNLKLSATFKNQSIDSILEIVSTSLDLKISKTKTGYEIE